jgi:4-hydroxy-2-oxoheptanedioate aldolase
MREDRIRTAVKQGRTLFNAWLTLNNPFLIELIGEAGWDCLTIDQQHGLGGNEALVGCLTAARACGLSSVSPRTVPGSSAARSMPARKGSCVR